MNTTTNYERFKFIDGNRPITQSNLKQKIDSIQRVGYIDGNPIICSKDMYEKTKMLYIIDGQHRFTALKKLGMPIPYELISGDVVTLIKELNASQKAWQLRDYINMWVNRRYPTYLKLNDFINKNGFKTVVGVNIAYANSTSGHDYSTRIKLGDDFIWNPRAQEIADYIKTSNVPYWENTNFIRACLVLFKKADDKYIKKLHSKLITIPQMAQSSQYLRAFENIINKNLSAKDKIAL